jgi:multiple sugar transport system permease protein
MKIKKNEAQREKHIKLKTKQSIVGFIFALPSLSGFALFFMIPFIISLYYCFTEGIGGAKFVGLKNFDSLLHSNSFILAAKNTLVFNLISVPLIIILSFAFAMLLNRKIKGLAFFRSFFILPLVIPVASVILVWNIIFSEFGVLSNIISKFHGQPVDWIRSDWSVGILVLLYIWKNCGYNVILLLAGLNNIPKEYYESAKIDGAGSFVCLTRITIPFLIPTGFFVIMISIVNSFKVFREAYLLAGSYPNLKIYMLQHFMNNNFFNLSYQRLTTAAFLMAIVITALVVILYKVEARFRRNI